MFSSTKPKSRGPSAILEVSVAKHLGEELQMHYGEMCARRVGEGVTKDCLAFCATPNFTKQVAKRKCNMRNIKETNNVSYLINKTSL